MLRKVKSHLERGTLPQTASSYLKRRLGLGPVNRFDITSREDAIRFLAAQCEKWTQSGSKAVLLVLDGQDDCGRRLKGSLGGKGILFEETTLDALDNVQPGQIDRVGCVVGCFLDSKRLTRLGMKLVGHPLLSGIPYEYALIPSQEYKTLLQNDFRKDSSFVSPLLISDIDFFDIYEESLARFEAKCEIRDFMDIGQILQYVDHGDIEGEIAEFGSYKGHSGYLIAQVLRAMGSAKKLYMFDMFEQFPHEISGVDALWNDTHQVVFEEVKAKLSAFDNTILVKGDFTETLPKARIGRLSFVFIDCDSYRGTKYILESTYDQVLSKRGIVVLEDYGHAPLLGSRLAFHEFFDERKDCFRFFSQFSGFQIVLKTGLG